MSSETPDVVLSSRSLFIRAGAGAGKTTQLINSFTEFVQKFKEQNSRYPKVVITTFTRKATQEVKERLLVNALKLEDQKLFEYINKKSYVQISTIHGLLSLFLSQNAELLSLPQDLIIVDQIKSDRLLKKLIHSLMKSKIAYVELLESYPFYKLIDIAREGLDLKYQNQKLNFVPQTQLEDLLNEKRDTILKKIQKIFDMVNPIPEKWTVYFEFLRGYQALVAKYKVDEAIIFFESEPKKPAFTTKNPPFAAEAHCLIEEVRDEDQFVFADTQAFRVQHEKLNSLFNQFLIELYELDIETKKRTGELTISDLENYSLKLIQSSPQASNEFSQSWDFFMIDEYQDTSPLQVKILNHLVADKPSFIVGDPQQSIYLFRGARSEVFDEKESELKSRNIEIRNLNTNYRSEPRLMNFINYFFKDFRQNFKPMQLKLELASSKLSEQVFYIQSHDETKATLKQIQHFLNQGIEAKDICVLSRKNSNLMAIAQEAYRVNIPVQLQSASGFEFKREILDLVAFLKFLVNPFDSENLVTLLRSPWLFVEDSVLVDLCQSKEAKVSLWSAITQSNQEILSKLSVYRSHYQQMGASRTLNKFISKTGFVSFSELLDPTGKREANIWKFLMAIVSAEKKPGFSLSLFLEDQFQSLQADLGSSSGEAHPVIQPDRVSLMTVHAAKGLEFKHVIIIGLTDRPQQKNILDLAFNSNSSLFSLAPFSELESKLVPSSWSALIRKEFNLREIFESERVLYVAMTRAQQSVTLVAEVARPNEKKIIVSESWFKKILWPEKSYETEEFSVASLFYDDLLSSNATEGKILTPVRLKKFLESTQPVVSHSVTEMISDLPIGPAETIQLNSSATSLKKAQRGTDLHRIFESLKYIPLEQLTKDLAEEEVKLVQYLYEQKQIDLKEILARGYNEWGFGVKYSGGVLQGQIDAWAELDNEIHILDYKTGSADFTAKAFNQLAIYTYALLKMKKISEKKKIIHSIIYPVDQRIIQKIFADAQDLIQKETALGDFFLD